MRRLELNSKPAKLCEFANCGEPGASLAAEGGEMDDGVSNKGGGDFGGEYEVDGEFDSTSLRNDDGGTRTKKVVVLLKALCCGGGRRTMRY